MPRDWLCSYPSFSGIPQISCSQRRDIPFSFRSSFSSLISLIISHVEYFLPFDSLSHVSSLLNFNQVWKGNETLNALFQCLWWWPYLRSWGNSSCIPDVSHFVFRLLCFSLGSSISSVCLALFICIQLWTASSVYFSSLRVTNDTRRP